MTIPEFSVPTLSTAERAARLTLPASGPVSVLIDTDTNNEVDDQFALTFALLSRRLVVDALYATQYTHPEGPEPEEGLELSYREIHAILDKLQLEENPPVLRGNSKTVAADPGQSSPAVKDLISRIRNAVDKPLYVIAIGALTNIAAAILQAPDIITGMVLIWLGGNEYGYEKQWEYNLYGDLEASRIVFASGVPLIRFPTNSVTHTLLLTEEDLQRHVAPAGEIGAYLSEILSGYMQAKGKVHKEIWDMAPVAFMEDITWGSWKVMPMPYFTEAGEWDFSSPNRPEHIVMTKIDAQSMMAAFFKRLNRYC